MLPLTPGHAHAPQSVDPPKSSTLCCCDKMGPWSWLGCSKHLATWLTQQGTAPQNETILASGPERRSALPAPSPSLAQGPSHQGRPPGSSTPTPSAPAPPSPRRAPSLTWPPARPAEGEPAARVAKPAPPRHVHACMHKCMRTTLANSRLRPCHGGARPVQHRPPAAPSSLPCLPARAALGQRSHRPPRASPSLSPFRTRR